MEVQMNCVWGDVIDHCPMDIHLFCKYWYIHSSIPHCLYVFSLTTPLNLGNLYWFQH